MNETIEQLVDRFVRSMRTPDFRPAEIALLAKFDAMQKELAAERKGRPLLAKATDRIADLENENTSLRDRCEVLEGAWNTRNDVAIGLAQENKALNKELAAWRKETKWGGKNE